MRMRAWLVVAVWWMSVPMWSQMLHADGPLPSFDVATIKPNDPNVRFAIRAPGAEPVQHAAGTARQLIAQAYMLFPNFTRVLGGPEWLDKQRYRVEGKIPDEIYAQMQKMTSNEKRAKADLMTQSLLAERFKLKVHFETREMPVYELVAKGKELVADSDIKLTKNADDDPSAHMVGGRGEDVNTLLFIANNVSMSELAQQLQGFVADRPVIDKTGIAGRYTFRLKVSPEGTALESAYPGQTKNPDNPLPSFLTAIQDLGLKLVPAKGPVEVLVIDHIELPTEN